MGQLDPPEGNDYVQVGVGDYHACALKKSGEIECWGAENTDYDFGQAISPSGTFVTLETTGLYNCALKDNGSVVVLGTK